jgi:hypothetical protein
MSERKEKMEHRQRSNEEGVNTMIKLKKSGIVGLTKEKKELLKRSVGKCTTKIDMNKVRDSLKYKFGRLQ